MPVTVVHMEDNNETQPIPGGTPDNSEAGTLTPAAAPPAPPAPLTEGLAASAPDRAGTSWRVRMLGLRAVAAVALASLVLGGVGGAALGALSDDGDDGQ